MPTLIESFPTTATRIPVEHGTCVDADITVPPKSTGIVLFAHGSGSSRHSPRNRFVATELNGRRLTTVLADLLTREEEAVDDRSGALRFDIPLLTRRLVKMIDWLSSYDLIYHLPIGLFGASTGAAAALDAAAERPERVSAVVSRGGRPDLAKELRYVRAATLLIVGGDDEPVIEMNRTALAKLSCGKKLEIVPGATHLFEETGALERVAALAGEWFEQHLR